MKIEKQVQMTLSNLDDEKYYFGTDNDFWLVYDGETDDAFEVWTSDGDGSGTDNQLISIPSGGAEITILSDLTVGNDLVVNNNLSIDNDVSVTGVLLVGATADPSDFNDPTLFVSNGDTGWTYSALHPAIVGEGKSTATGSAVGGLFVGQTSSTRSAYAFQAAGKASDAADTTTAFGFYAYAYDAHAGPNVGAAMYVANGTENYALNVYAGDFKTAEMDWDLVDNNSSALSFDASGKTGILEIDTTNSAEKVNMSGGLSVAGSVVSLSGLPTSDPAVAGQLWVDTSASYVIKVSQG